MDKKKTLESSMDDLAQNLQVLKHAIDIEPNNPIHLYEYCLSLRALSRTMEAVPYLEKLNEHEDWYGNEISSAALGILGFLGLSVMLDQITAPMVDFFRNTTKRVGEASEWSDVRLAVPYALLLSRERNYPQSADVLERCVKSGLVAHDVLVTLSERISPVVLLLSIYKQLDQDDALYSFIGELPQLLAETGIDLNEIFEVVHAQDQELFDHIFELLRQRNQESG